MSSVSPSYLPSWTRDSRLTFESFFLTLLPTLPPLRCGMESWSTPQTLVGQSSGAKSLLLLFNPKTSRDPSEMLPNPPMTRPSSSLTLPLSRKISFQEHYRLETNSCGLKFHLMLTLFDRTFTSRSFYLLSLLKVQTMKVTLLNILSSSAKLFCQLLC